MPIITTSFKPFSLFRHPKIQTIAPALLRNPRPLKRERVRLETSDGDFVDIDQRIAQKNAVAIISHGLEGSSQSQYVIGIARALESAGFDTIAWNMRGCSGENNRLLTSYHSGFTADLDAVIEYAGTLGYEHIALIGFSVGGNITLKYLGENSGSLSPRIKAALVYSVPLDLRSTAEELALAKNALYMKVFLRSLLEKLAEKAVRFPGAIDLSGADEIKTFAQYDSRYIAPLFGYASAEEYWVKASSKPFLPSIKVPTLLLTSVDDPFLRPASIPTDAAAANPFFYLEVSQFGGHVGFMRSLPWGSYYSEMRGVTFLSEYF